MCYLKLVVLLGSLLPLVQVTAAGTLHGKSKPAGKPTSHDLLRGTSVLAQLWREASLPDNRRTPQEIIAHYRRVLDTSQTIDSPFENWYLAVTHFGMARAFSRLNMPDSVRTHIRLAIEKNFWNFDVMYADPTLRDCAGHSFIDSLASYYKIVREESQEQWPEQIPIVHGPNELREWAERAPNVDTWFPDNILRRLTLDSIYQAKLRELQTRLRTDNDDKINVIIALHGGNASYREFGSHWSSIGQMTNSYVICPPGFTRYSKCLNGWEGEYSDMDGYLLSIMEQLRNKDGDFPNIYVTGYSQGACLAIKFGLAHPDLIKGVISFCGFMDMEIEPEVAEAARKNGLKIFAINGEYDSPQFKQSLSLTKSTLSHHGVQFKLLEEKKITHELPDPIFFHFMEAWSWLKS